MKRLLTYHSFRSLPSLKQLSKKLKSLKKYKNCDKKYLSLKCKFLKTELEMISKQFLRLRMRKLLAKVIMKAGKKVD